MKLTLITMLLLPAMVAGEETAPFSGTWDVHNSIAGNESQMTCTFTQKEKELTGSCTSDKGAVNVTGKVDDKKVNWVYKSEYNGGPITLTYAGTLEGKDKMTGTVNVAEFSVDGDFTAALSK